MLLYRLFDNFIVLFILSKIYVLSLMAEIEMNSNITDLILLSIVIFKETNIFKKYIIFQSISIFSFGIDENSSAQTFWAFLEHSS